MLYHYCREILEPPRDVCWRIFHLNDDGSTECLLRRGDRDMTEPGKYIILDRNVGPVDIKVTPDKAPRRVYSRSPSSDNIERDSLQAYFRDGLRKRPQVRYLRNEPSAQEQTIRWT